MCLALKRACPDHQMVPLRQSWAETQCRVRKARLWGRRHGLWKEEDVFNEFIKVGQGAAKSVGKRQELFLKNSASTAPNPAMYVYSLGRGWGGVSFNGEGQVTRFTKPSLCPALCDAVRYQNKQNAVASSGSRKGEVPAHDCYGLWKQPRGWG